ncbi:NAD-dependent epimerase/dehydratase family protein [Candidatus Gottesmanbacteria bacterium]|nr:NAD-dependent epimerase/dehydratase family protein [Candidatus Gottesmanbacteria bacterium]
MERLTGQTVLVTGGTGLVGGHVIELLLGRGYRVVTTVRSHDPNSYFITKELDQKVISVHCDVNDTDRVIDVVTRYEIDSIIHLAASAIVTTSYENPAEAIRTNVLGSVSILEAARRTPRVHGVILASSDKAYGKLKKIYREDDPLRGDHPYEVSKSAADLIANAYWQTYGVPVAITRFGNIYGPGDLHNSRIIPGIMNSLVHGVPVVLRSDGTYIRDYIYVGDVARAYVFLLERMGKIKGQAFNISSEVSCSVIELIKRTEKILHKRIRYSIANTSKNEIPYQHLDWEKIKNLGWMPHYSLRGGILKTLAWYKKYG